MTDINDVMKIAKMKQKNAILIVSAKANDEK